jgi:uncharacterized protein (TIGR03437 family)
MNAARALLLFLFAGLIGQAIAQSLDNSGNGMLNGTYYFRQVLYTSNDTASLYGNISFDGNGNYSINGSVCDSNNGCNPSAPVAFTHTGTYVIGASGFGYITSPGISADLVYGMVSKGIFIGSSTEDATNRDFFIAAPVSSTPATNSTFQGAYWISYTDPVANIRNPTAAAVDALFQANPNGQGNLGTINASGYFEATAGSASTLSQTLTGVRYAFSNGAANVTFGGNGKTLLPTNALMYISPDGNFVFGGAYNLFDFFVGVRATSGMPNFNGLYYQAGIDSDLQQFDAYYGSFNAISGNTFLEHQRLSGGSDVSFFDTYSLNPDGTYDDQNLSQHYVFGESGAIRIGFGQSYSGQNPILGISVALAAPSFSGPGVYLNPTGVLNAGSSSPFTAHLSPGEFISLYGTGLASGNASASSLPLPTKLGGVQVMINGRPAPLSSVSPGQINAVVPYFTESIAQIQVISNNASSNIVTELMNLTSPGIFTYSPTGGTGDAAALHSNYSVVSSTSPALAGETIQVYVSGLGAVTPAVADGAPGSGTSPYNTTTNPIQAYIGGTAANSTFSGLAPGFAGVYQMNITVPTGLTAGDYYLEIQGPDSDTVEAGIPIGSGTAAAVQEPTAQGRSTADRAVPASKQSRRVHGSSLHRESGAGFQPAAGFNPASN